MEEKPRNRNEEASQKGSRAASSSASREHLFDLGATALFAGFTAFLVFGLIWSSGVFNDLAAPFLLGSFGTLYLGNRRQDAHGRTP
jgi:hypothetical protein